MSLHKFSRHSTGMKGFHRDGHQHIDREHKHSEQSTETDQLPVATEPSIIPDEPIYSRGSIQASLRELNITLNELERTHINLPELERMKQSLCELKSSLDFRDQIEGLREIRDTTRSIVSGLQMEMSSIISTTASNIKEMAGYIADINTYKRTISEIQGQISDFTKASTPKKKNESSPKWLWIILILVIIAIIIFFLLAPYKHVHPNHIQRSRSALY